MAAVKKVANPFDTMEVLPTDSKALETVLNTLFESGVSHVSQLLTDFRNSTAARKDEPRPFTRGDYNGILMTVAFLWAENQRLLQHAREKRDQAENQITMVEHQTRASRALADNLLKRVDALEAIPRQVYRGTWAEGVEYHEGNSVTFSGSVWWCWRTTRQQPGDGPDFTLMVKRGKDAR
jgi:hypothetical protein